MVFIFSILSIISLVATVLPVSSSRLEDRVARRRNHRRLNLVDRDSSELDIEYYTTWAGAILDEDNGTFDTVTGIFTVPELTGPDGIAAAWVGIDGRGCSQGLLQAGIDFTMADGQPSYDAWWEWFPDWSNDFSTGMTVNPGDVVQTTVTARSVTSGVVVMENLTTNQTAIQEITSKYALCLASVEWIVEDYEGDGVPLVDFGTVTFTGTNASGPSGQTYTPAGATIAEIRQSGKVLTSVSTTKSAVTIKYI